MINSGDATLFVIESGGYKYFDWIGLYSGRCNEIVTGVIVNYTGAIEINPLCSTETTPQISGDYKSFSQLYNRIEPVVEKYRQKWYFKASVMEDFEDVKIEILEHVNTKWGLYDQRRPLENWVARITHNKFINKLRDSYMGTASPCNACQFNEGDGMCAKFGMQGVECNFFKEWYYKKRYKHQARMPFSSDDPNHPTSVSELPSKNINLEEQIELFHGRIKPLLTDSEWEIYHRLYIRNISEEDTAIELKFKSNEVGQKSGYRRIREVKRIIIEKSKQLLKREGLEV